MNDSTNKHQEDLISLLSALEAANRYISEIRESKNLPKAIIINNEPFHTLVKIINSRTGEEEPDLEVALENK